MTQQFQAPCPVCGYPLDASPCGKCHGDAVAVDEVTEVRPGTGFFLADMFDGFVSLFHASLLLMTKKAYIGKLTVAILANLVFVVLFAGGIMLGVYSMIQSIDWGFDWARAAAAGLAILLALVSTWFLAPTLVSAGMAPFLDPIANATEMLLAGEEMKPVEVGAWRGLTAGISAAAHVLVLQVCVLVPVLLLSLVPVVGWAAVAFGTVFSAYLNALVWFEIPMVRRGYGWDYRRQIVRRNWARSIGFGLAFNLGLLVPIFNVLFIGPATAVAVSALYFRFEKMTPMLEQQLQARRPAEPELARPEPQS